MLFPALISEHCLTADCYCAVVKLMWFRERIDKDKDFCSHKEMLELVERYVATLRGQAMEYQRMLVMMSLSHASLLYK